MDKQEIFINLREEFSRKLEPANYEANISSWNFYTNSTEENMQKMQEADDTVSNLYKDKIFYEKFLSIDKSKLCKHEAKQLKDILRIFDEELNTGDAKKALREKENEIARKYNSYIPMLDGKEITNVKIAQILQTEVDSEIRRKAYEAKIKGGDLIANDLIEFIKMRNNYAKTKGYNNFFEYKLKEAYDVNIEQLEKLIDEVYSNAHDKIAFIQKETQQELKDFFQVETLKPWHYGFLLDSNPEKGVNEILKKNNIEEISKQTYMGMGYNIDKMIEDGKLTLDLYPRKGKNTHGFCFGIKAGEDSRILANLINNTNSLDTLNHEMGHCIYDLGILNTLPYFDQEPASSAFTEAIAMMMGDIIKKENILKDLIPQNLFIKFQNSHKKDEAKFISRSLQIIDFEREFYKNPDQNPANLWQNIKQKYLNRNEEANNEWATIPHYLSHPSYYQNYFRATLMKAQIYNHLKSVLGNITENKSTAEYLIKNIFSYGASVDEYDLIKQLTGKDFSAKDFIKSL